MRKTIVPLLLALFLRSVFPAYAGPLFDLVDNRTLAHSQAYGGLYIAAGAPGFAKYVHFSRPTPTWKLGKLLEGKRVALPSTQAVLEVPLTAAQSKASSVTIRLWSPLKQSLKISAKEKASAAVPVSDGWQTLSVPVPAGLLQEGESKLLLTFAQSSTIAGQKAAAAVEWIAIGNTAALEDGALGLASRAGLTLSRGSGLAYYLQIPEGGSLIATGDLGGCTVSAAVSHGGKRLVEGNLVSGQPLDLSAASGKVARVDLVAEGASCTRTTLKAALHNNVASVSVSRAPAPKNVIVWLTDSTRADKYRVFNPKTRVETKVMDGWQKQATLFRTAYVQGNESRVSHASLFTGLYAKQHNFIAEKAKLDSKFITFPEIARAARLKTGGFMANGFIDAFWGFGEGWDTLKNHIHDGGGLKAEDLVKVGKNFLQQVGQQRFLMYLGTIDAHVSWRAHSPWFEKYDPAPYSGPFTKACTDPQLDEIVAGKLKVNERDKVRILALYESNVSYNDQQFGELVAHLEKIGHKDDTMIILTADHGEEMYEHGKIGHGQSLHEELVHVPLAIYYPPLFPAGKLVDEGVEVIDILPTIAEALGQPIPKEAQGESLIAIAQGQGVGYPRPAIASQYELAHTMRLGKYKLWIGGSGVVHLYDALNDAAENKDLIDTHPIERRFVTDAMSMWMANQTQWKKTRWGVASNHKAELAADLEDAK